MHRSRWWALVVEQVEQEANRVRAREVDPERCENGLE
jgi:hypothetical protein